MKKLFSILAIALMAVCFVGCAKSNDSEKEEATEVKENKNTPEAVMKAYFKAQKECDFAKAFSYTTLTEEEQQQMADFFNSLVDDKVKKEMAATEFKITDVEMDEDGESAIVNYIEKNIDGEERESSQEMVKVDGEWKIYFKK